MNLVGPLLTAIEQIVSNALVTPLIDKRMKITTYNFIMGLITCSSTLTGHAFSLSRLYIVFMAQLKVEIGWTTFRDRLNTKKLKNDLLSILHALLTELRTSLNIEPDFCKKLGVDKILILDATSCPLPDAAAGIFPGTGTGDSPAGIKNHFLLDLFSGCLRWFDLTPASVHENGHLPALASMKNMLLLADLGYYNFKLFYQMTVEDVYFLSRVKVNTIIEITKVISNVGKKNVGRFLSDLIGHRGAIIEFIGSIIVPGQEEKLTVRVIGVWNQNTREYHYYMTNLPDSVTKELIWPLYGLRWQVELEFKGLKGFFRIDEISSSKKNIIENLMHVNLIMSVIAAKIAVAALNEMDDPEKSASYSLQRVCSFFKNISVEFFHFLTRQNELAKQELLNLIHLLRKTLYDKNYKRRKSSVGKAFQIINAMC